MDAAEYKKLVRRYYYLPFVNGIIGMIVGGGGVAFAYRFLMTYVRANAFFAEIVFNFPSLVIFTSYTIFNIVYKLYRFPPPAPASYPYSNGARYAWLVYHFFHTVCLWGLILS